MLNFDFSDFVSGVVVGVTVALILGVFNVAIRYSDRLEQQQYVRALIQKHLGAICGASPIVDLSLKHVQYILYRNMIDDLNKVLDVRSTKIKYAKKARLLLALPVFYDTDNLAITNVPPRPEVMVKQLLPGLIDQLKDVKWLKIAPDMSCEGNQDTS